ncbi:MAG: PD40 domain-containing protein [Anaerolineae bacterium]|nr:PD40 domain-containing protein [Anaerolineae bacterium]
MQTRFIMIIMLVMWIFIIAPINAQTDDTTPIITPENARSLRLSHTIGDGRINEAVYSPDGQTIAVASTSGAWLYDADNLQADPILLAGHTDPIRRVIFSPSGRRLAGIGGNKAFMWYIPTRELWFSWNVGLDISDITFDADDLRLIATSDYGATIWVWSARDGALLGRIDRSTFETPSSFSLGLSALHPDNTSLFATIYSLNNRRINGLWTFDIQTLAPIRQNTDITNITSFKFSDDGTYFVTIMRVNNDYHISLFETSTQALLYDIPHTDYIRWVDFSPDGQQIVSAWQDTFTIWDTQTGDYITHYAVSLPSHSVMQATFSPDGQRILAIINNLEGRYMMEWDIASGEILQTINPIAILAFSITSDSRQLVSHIGHIFDLDTGELISYTPDTPLYIPPVNEANEMASQFISNCQNRGACTAMLNPDKTQIAIAEDYSFMLQIFDTATGEEIRQLDHDIPIDFPHWQHPRAIAYSPDGRVIATATFRAIYLWDAHTGDILTILGGLNNGFQADLVFTPDGRYLCSVSDDLVVQVWGVSDNP